MAFPTTNNDTEMLSNENSISTKEFLHIEKSCELYKDSDEEIKLIFNEINKLSGACANEVEGDLDDVDLILKRAEVIAKETKDILQQNPLDLKSPVVPKDNRAEVINIPVIKITKPNNEHKYVITENGVKNEVKTKLNGKENCNEPPRRKQRTRPFSAGVVDVKKKEAANYGKSMSNSPKKIAAKHDALVEELKDTNERVKNLEMLNVKYSDDNKTLRKKLEEISEQKHIIERKLIEGEKFISRLGKEYENRNAELKDAKENENKLLTEVSRERGERKSLAAQREKDVVIIQDLQRQCKEMEMILRRKHPDSVSALIVAAKSSSVEDNKRKLLEERTARLEQELKDKEEHFQGILLTLQEKFGDMKQKYESHIIDVERQLMEDRKVNAELKSKINRSNLISLGVQTDRNLHSIGTQTNFRPTQRASSAVSRLSQNSSLILNKLKEDSYLVATIKGLQGELTVKQRTIAKINRETEELRKSLRNLQKEKEVLINLNPQKRSICRQAKSSENILARVNGEMEVELSEIRKQKEVLMMERNSLLESLKRTNEEFIHLKKKRIQDLHTLQLAHEKELMQMNMQIYPLQEEIQMLNRTVEVLQERERCDDMKYQGNMKDSKMNGGGDAHRNGYKY